MIPWLDEANPVFPDQDTALTDPNGLLAAGGNLEASTLIKAYKNGLFPWFGDEDPILWWTPNPRAVIYPSKVHISKSMKKCLRSTNFSMTADTAFEDVIQNCSSPRNYTSDTWITDEMKQAYINLHRLGYAHSIEVWQQNTLVGGLYGINIGSIFFGESMFSMVSNASKFGFIKLCQILDECGYKLIDCQVNSEHMVSLGAIEISRKDFINTVKVYTEKAPDMDPWSMINK